MHLNPSMAGILIKEEKGHRDRNTQGENGYVTREAKIGVSIYKPRNTNDYSQTLEVRGGKKDFLSWGSEEAWPC